MQKRTFDGMLICSDFDGTFKGEPGTEIEVGNLL
jgi:hypothetical protein